MDYQQLKETLLGFNSEAEKINMLKTGRSQKAPEYKTIIEALEPESHKVNDRAYRPDKMVVATPEQVDAGDNFINVNAGNGERVAKRPEPVARIALALQKLIVKRAVAFIFGNPVTLTCETEGEGEEKVLKALKSVYFKSKVKSVNKKVASQVFTMTEAAEYWYTVKKDVSKLYGFETPYKLRCSVFSPLKGDSLYPFFDESGDMIAFSREYYREDNNKKRTYYFETFTEKEHIVWKQQNSTWEVERQETNPIGKIPVIYACQKEPEWQDVQGLIERLEKLLSNFADTNDYHASPKIFVKGTVYGWAKKGESGAVIEGDKDAEAQYLSWDQAPEAVKLEIETLLKMIYTITQTPDISFDSVKGLNLSGVALKLLFMDAHLKAKDHAAETFDEYLQRRNSVVQAYLKQMNAGDKAFTEACDTIEVEPEINPYIIGDDAQTVQMLMQATGNRAILSRETAIENLGWVNNPEKELEKIQADEKADFDAIGNATEQTF